MTRKDWWKLYVIGALVAIAAGITWYFHFVLEMGSLFTHFFYVPIILAAYWWGRKGVIVAVGLVLFLLASDIVRSDYDMLRDDLVRSMALLGISMVVAFLRESGLKAEVGLRQANKELAKENEGRRKAEESIAVANRKLNLLSKITRHDILNRLTVLEGNLVLQQERCHDEECRKNMERMMPALRSITRDMEFTRDYEEIGTHGPGWQSVPALFEQAALKLGMGAVRMSVDTIGLEVLADRMLIKVFYNLLDDSLRHGQEVTRVSLRAERKADELVLIYEDDGIGVSVDEKAQIFDLGVISKGGSGLFLAREILSITNITIVENGVPGKGARFEMTVPRGGHRII